MRLSTSLALAALGLAASALPAAAGTLLVPQQFPTIQGALNAARPYDTVRVSAKPNGGVYSEAVTIRTPHVVLQGVGGPVLDGSKLGVLVPQPAPFTPYVNFPNGVEIKADHVAVRGMTVQGFGYQESAFSSAAAGINVGTYVLTGNFTGYEVSFSDIEVSGDTLQKNSTGLTIHGYTGDPRTGFTSLSGYRVLGNLISGNSNGGASLDGNAVLVSGNRVTDNQYSDGLSVTGVGVTVTGNEAGGNGGYGLNISDAANDYNPAVNDPKYPNPAPTVTSGNSVHDNAGGGIEVIGTQTVSGNSVVNNVGYGVHLSYADYSAVSFNLITGTAALGYGDGDGAGIYAEYGDAYYGADDGLKVSFNQISGNAGDGVYFSQYAGGVISYNNVTGNQGIGIHLSDYGTLYTFYGYGGFPTTVTQNRALKNALFDARDDASAPDDVTYNYATYYGDAGYYGPTANVWTKNLFGTSDPVGLSK